MDAVLERHASSPYPDEVRARSISAIERLAPEGSALVQQARRFASWGDARDANQRLWALLVALREDYAAGYMRSVEELIHADVFDDFLEMAEGLHTQKYKDAAAVIAGSVLEEHLRKLAAVHNVAITSSGKHKKADTINGELVKQGAYNKLEQKNVTAWLGLRNHAAHGEYDKYDHKQVTALITGVRDFVTRHPA